MLNLNIKDDSVLKCHLIFGDTLSALQSRSTFESVKKSNKRAKFNKKGGRKVEAAVYKRGRDANNAVPET